MSIRSHPWLGCSWKKPILSLRRMTNESLAVVSNFLNAKWSPGSFSWHKYYELLKKPSFFTLYWFRHLVKFSWLNWSNRGSNMPKCSLDCPQLCSNQHLSRSGWLQEKMYQGVSAQHPRLLKGCLVKFPAEWIVCWVSGQSGHPVPSLVQIKIQMGNRPGQGLSWHWLEKVSNRKGFNSGVNCRLTIFFLVSNWEGHIVEVATDRW